MKLSGVGVRSRTPPGVSRPVFKPRKVGEQKGDAPDSGAKVVPSTWKLAVPALGMYDVPEGENSPSTGLALGNDNWKSAQSVPLGHEADG